jgi:hypothetical protein
MRPENPDPARGWLHVEKLLANEEIEEVDALDDEALAAALRARGRDPSRLTTVNALMTRAAAIAAQKARAPAPIAARRRRPPEWVLWLAAAAVALAAIVAVVVYVNAPPRAIGRAPDPARYRAAGFAACRDHRWDDCASALDVARDLDPPGESLPEVKEARAAIAAASVPAPSASAPERRTPP